LQIRPYRTVSGQFDGAVLTVYDIDAIKRREEERAKAELANARLAAIIESSDDAIISKSLDGTVTSWNHAARSLFGYAPEEIVGKSILMIIPEDRHEEERKIIARLVRGERIDHFETVRRRKDGSSVDISLSVSPVRDSAGRIIGASKIARDISRLKQQQLELNREVVERRKAEDRVRDLNQALEGRVRERTAELEAFSYSIAHDLRGPLRSIHRFSELLGDEYSSQLDEQGRDYLKRLSDGAARMDLLIDDLLDYSKVARTDIHPHAVELDALCAEIRHELSEEIRERKGRVVVQPDLPRVLGDRLLLRQALINLVSNGLKFVAPGVTPEVMITTEVRPDAVRIRIQDNGIGIPQEHHGRVFQIFERLNPLESYPGTGVGLAIVKKAVDRMKGTLGLDSQPGRGSTFWIDLPPAGSK
jgi:PAS domain S-box-containing protein